MRLYLLTFALFLLFGPLTHGQRFSLGFWNVENFYDTIPSLFYDDIDYTPQGRMLWGAERYGNKLNNLAKVIDEMSLDIVGIAEVESEQAVRDLVVALKTDYNYIHRITGDRRGMDMALLYKGDKFIPCRVALIKSSSPREFLYVRGELSGERVDIVVCHLPSQFNNRGYRERSLSALYYFADSLHRMDSDARLIIMGDFNTTPSERIMRNAFRLDWDLSDSGKLLFSPLSRYVAEGKGTYVYNDRWHLLDNMFLSVCFLGGTGLRYDECGIFIRSYMIDNNALKRRGYPLRTFSAGRYLNGYSDHLPIYLYLKLYR